MSSPPNQDITYLLHALSEGEEGALDELLPLVLDDLRAMARRYMAREPVSATFAPTDLVQDVFLRLDKRRQLNFANRRHFFGSAACMMRRILVDRARRKDRQRHGGGHRPEPLSQEPKGDRTADPAVVLAVHQALERLEAKDPRAAKVVELRFFLGMTVDEAASGLERSPATVKRDWDFARLWLQDQLGSLASDEPDTAGDDTAEDKSTED